jgi:hypothetical protein
LYVAESASPLSHVPELGKLDFAEVRSANAPAAMYFVVSVLPISTTSGTVPAASDASSLARCSVHCCSSTFTWTPGCFAWNAAVAASIAACQPDFASG